MAALQAYTCAACKQIFFSDRDDEEALQEARQVFGKEIDREPLEVVCDVCWEKMVGARN